jgi:hypothetical protein
MMVKYYTLEDFRKEIFLPFNEAVEHGTYEKFPYKQWRNLNNWSKDPIYEQMKIVREEIVKDGGTYMSYEYRWLVGPSSRNCIVPNPEVFSIEDNSFGSYLELIFVKSIRCDISATELNQAIYKPADDFCGGLTTFADTTTAIQSNLDELVDKVCKQMEEHYNKKENKEMMKFDFGPVNSNVRMSMYGMAIKNANGTYVAYDAASGHIMDVDILNFEGADKLFYKMPVAVGPVRPGDIVVHMGKPMFVSAVLAMDCRFKVLDIWSGEEKTIVPTKSPFGFEFMTKIVSLMDFGNANKDNPFGNMLPLLLLNDSNSKDNTALMMAMMYGHTDMMKNPMLVYAAMGKDGKMNDVLPFLLMGGFGANPNGCCGNCSCDKDK